MKLRENKGFTLLELLIYIAILSAVTLVIASLFVSMNKGQGQVESRNEVDSNLQFSVEKINRDLKSASLVTTPASPNASSTSLILISGGQTITYDVSAGRLRRQIDAQDPQIITSDKVTVAEAIFTRLENTNQILNKTVVSVSLNILMNYNSQSPDYQYSERKKTTAALK
jgi:type II secretory pathway component PulJ